MEETKPGQEMAREGVTHHKTETITTDHEKVIAALGPSLEKLAPLIQAWQTGEVEKAQTQSATNTAAVRSSNRTIAYIVTVFCVLAGLALWRDANGVSEKIVIGLLAFLGGFTAGRR